MGNRTFADYNGDVTGIFASCYLNIEEHGSLSLPPLRKSQNNDERQEFMASVADIEQFLNGQASFRKNTVTGKCEVLTAGSGGKYEELTDRYVNTLWCRMCKEAKPGQAAHIRAVLDSEFVDTFNPFEQYFKTCHPGTEPPITSRNLPPTYTSGQHHSLCLLLQEMAGGNGCRPLRQGSGEP